MHTGEKIQHPQPLKASLKQLRQLNKSVSRKVRGSNNWWRVVHELVRLYRKLATDLCQRFDRIATETLNLDGNMKRLWDRKRLRTVC